MTKCDRYLLFVYFSSSVLYIKKKAIIQQFKFTERIRFLTAIWHDFEKTIVAKHQRYIRLWSKLQFILLNDQSEDHNRNFHWHHHNLVERNGRCMFVQLTNKLLCGEQSQTLPFNGNEWDTSWLSATAIQWSNFYLKVIQAHGTLRKVFIVHFVTVKLLKME